MLGTEQFPTTAAGYRRLLAWMRTFGQLDPVLDGSKALRRAVLDVLDVFDALVLARCQLHKIRNVRDKLPPRLRPTVERRLRDAYHAPSALAAGRDLLKEEGSGAVRGRW